MDEPPGVVDLAQTSTELLEVWAPVQVPEKTVAELHPDVAAIATSGITAAKKPTIIALSRSLFQTKLHSIQLLFVLCSVRT